MKLLALAATAASMACLSSVAVAANCGPTGPVMRSLLDKYQEAPAFVASFASGAVLTITVSPKGTWTALSQISPDTVCVVASGTGWATAPSSLSKPPAIQPNGLEWPDNVYPNGRYLRGPI